jgi:hypothetical protein
LDNKTNTEIENCTLLGYYAAINGNLIINYHYSLRNNPEERSSQRLPSGSLTSCITHKKCTRTKYNSSFGQNTGIQNKLVATFKRKHPIIDYCEYQKSTDQQAEETRVDHSRDL